MSCTGYVPRFVKQLDGSRYAGLNCTCASAAMAADDDSCGAKRTTASAVRSWTGDTNGGTTLAQVDAALQSHLGVDLDVRYRYPWTEFVRRIDKGEGAILQGWYMPIRNSRFRGSETFGSNHAIYVPTGWGAMDPLADGRRPGIYKYHGEAYPQSLLRDFAGKLNIGGTGRYVALGAGLVYAGFTRDQDVTYKAIVHPTPPAKTVEYSLYTVTNGVISRRVQRTTTGFTVASVSPPRLYRWPSGSPATLVQCLTGSLKGFYLPAIYSRTIP
jgi:hypothetical protein